MMDPFLLTAQANEITEHLIYSDLAKRTGEKHNRKILEHIAADELNHYHQLKKHTYQEVKPRRLKVWFYFLLASLLGLSFALKLMEKGEKLSQAHYHKDDRRYALMLKDELRHENDLVDLLRDQKIEYAGSIVLGLNDALVELTGALAGLTFAFRDGKIIALTGSITGVAAALSMSASAYLSSQEEQEKGKKPLPGAIYTGATYLATVVLLVLPFLFLGNAYLALGTTLGITFLIIAFYTFYITTAKTLKFWPRFLKMACISLGVAVISFGFGLLLKKYFGMG